MCFLDLCLTHIHAIFLRSDNCAHWFTSKSPVLGIIHGADLPLEYAEVEKKMYISKHM